MIGRWLRGAERRQYGDLQAFCLFIGYPRSGHTLVGALLDAHPDIVIAQGANALRLVVVEGASRSRLYETLLENSRREAAGGRRGSGYSYVVDGQWQGRVRTLRVIGDKTGKKTAGWLSRDPSALAKLRRTVHLPLRFVHVTRNPYDTIARMTLITRGGAAEHSLGSATSAYARLARLTAGLIEEERYPVYTIRHESIVAAPHMELQQLCGFLGVDADDSYLDACAGILFPSPRRTRELIEWPADAKKEVEQIIARHSFLHGYSWSRVE